MNGCVEELKSKGAKGGEYCGSVSIAMVSSCGENG